MPTSTVKLIYGDCLNVMKDIPDNSIDMVLADMPYGITKCQWDTQIPLNLLWEQYIRICKLNAAIVLTSIQPFTSVLVLSKVKMFKYSWVWQKEAGTGLLNSKKQPLRDHEDVLVFYQKQPIYNPQFSFSKPYKIKKGGETEVYNKSGTVITESDGRRYPKTVLRFNRDKERYHPTQKPVKLMEYLILTYTNPGMLVLDNVMGSGSTGIACINAERNFIGIENDAKYFEIANNRISNLMK